MGISTCQLQTCTAGGVRHAWRSCGRSEQTWRVINGQGIADRSTVRGDQVEAMLTVCVRTTSSQLVSDFFSRRRNFDWSRQRQLAGVPIAGAGWPLARKPIRSTVHWGDRVMAMADGLTRNRDVVATTRHSSTRRGHYQRCNQQRRRSAR